MSDDNQNIFGESPNDTDTSQNTGNDPFNQLVGEGKKFSDAEALAAGKLESDRYIEQLKREQQELRDELAKRPSKEEMLDIVKAAREESGDTTSGLDEEAVKSMINAQVVEMGKEERKRANSQKAIATMIEKFGDKAADVTAAKATELGVSVDYLKSMAETSPALFLSTMGVTASPQGRDTSNQSVQGSVNTEQLQEGKPSSADSWSYYENMRKEKPSEYFSPKTQNEIFEKRKRLGEAFMNS